MLCFCTAGGHDYAFVCLKKHSDRIKIIPASFCKICSEPADIFLSDSFISLHNRVSLNNQSHRETKSIAGKAVSSMAAAVFFQPVNYIFDAFTNAMPRLGICLFLSLAEQFKYLFLKLALR